MDPVEPEDLAATEAWFVKRGLPHAIDQYSASEDVLTRAAPLLSVVFVLEVFASFSGRFDGWAQAGVFVLGSAILLASVAVVNRLRGRAALSRPDRVGLAEVTVFLLAPALLPLLFSDDRWTMSAALVIANASILAGAYVVTSFGVLPIARFGAAQMWRRMGRIGQLVARTLPLLLLLTTFVFLNAEMWQVASDFEPAHYAIGVSFLVMAGVGFMALRAPREVEDLEFFESWAQVEQRARRTDAPIAELAPSDTAAPVAHPPHDRRHRVNVALMVVIAQFVQVLLVALVIGSFYVGFGLLAVRAATIEQWTTAPSEPLATFDLLGGEVVVTWEHMAVAGFIAAFSALQFAVSMLTDATYREEFYDDVTGEIRDVLAVRVLYHDAIGRSAAP